MLEGATKPLTTDQNANNLPIPAENDEPVDNNNRLYLTRSETERIIDYAMARYERSALRCLADRIIQHEVQSSHRITANKQIIVLR